MKIAPKNWADFQHYKDRAPPWIKLHKGLLDNFEFHSLQLASRALAPMLWLLASEEKDGVIDKTSEQLAFRLRCTPADVDAAVNDLIDKGFFVSIDEPATKPLAKRKQDAMPETETETYKAEVEGETKAEKEAEVPAPQSDANPLNAATWKSYKHAYSQRYGVDPVRNATVNSQIKQFVARLGAESPDVAAFYVRSNAAFYVRGKHGAGLMVKDAEGLRTEWATGRTVTQTEALQADKTQARGNVWGELIEEARNAAIA